MVFKKAIRKTFTQADEIVEQFTSSSTFHRDEIFRVVQTKYLVPGDEFFLWIDVGRRLNIVLPRIAVMKKTCIATNMGTSSEGVRAS